MFYSLQDDEKPDKAVGSKKGISVAKAGTKLVYRSRLTAEPDILRDVGSLSLD